jgi:DNA repair protein RAD50
MSDAAKMQRELDQFRTLVADVERYEKQLQDRLEMKKDLQAKKSLLDSQRSERARLQKELATDQESAAKNEKIDGDIKANLEYRERERAIVQHQKKIDERTAQLRAVSGGELLEDLRHLNLRLVRQKEKRSELRGSMHSEARMCEDIIATLTSERYRHIDDRYKTKLIDVKTHQLANADLETYHRALDRALMHYHSLKMKEINEVSRTGKNQACFDRFRAC